MINYSDLSANERATYNVISPKQFYKRINQDLDEPIGLSNIYKMIKQADFPSFKFGGRYYIIENLLPNWFFSKTTKYKN